MTIKVINVAGHLEHCEVANGGILQQRSLCSQEMPFTALFLRALDRFLFEDICSGACLHQGPVRKHKGQQGNPELSDLYNMSLDEEFKPYTPVMVSDMKVSDSEMARKETALYANCCMHMHIASPLILGFPVTKNSAELFIFVPVNNGWCGIQVAALPDDLECPSPTVIDKTVIFFHDKSTFQCNDDQPTLWATKETSVMRPKSKGAGIMVSDFICEHDGFLCFTAGEYEAAKVSDPTIRLQARQFLEYGESREGYWTSEKFMKQIEVAVRIAEIKYPKSQGWKHVWVFDHSSCHAAMADDALDVSKMNVNPGGKQRKMRDG